MMELFINSYLPFLAISNSIWGSLSHDVLTTPRTPYPKVYKPKRYRNDYVRDRLVRSRLWDCGSYDPGSNPGPGPKNSVPILCPVLSYLGEN